MKVYLMHKKGFTDRFNKVTDLLLKCNFIEDLEIIMCEQSKVVFSTIEEKSKILPEDFPKVEINKGNKSLIHKQFTALEKIANSNKPAIILEDDVIFDPKSLDNFINEFLNIPNDWEFCFFGTCSNLKIDGTGFVENKNRMKSRCTDSMVIHPNAAKKIYEDMKKTKAHLPIDWDLAYRFIKLNIKVYWYEPGIVQQGSETGVYKSAIHGS